MLSFGGVSLILKKLKNVTPWRGHACIVFIISFSEIKQENLKGKLFLSKRELSPASEKDPILRCLPETKNKLKIEEQNKKRKVDIALCFMQNKSLFSFAIYIGNILEVTPHVVIIYMLKVEL